MDQPVFRNITSTPSAADRLRCGIFAYVDAGALATKERVEVCCNCSTMVPYQTSARSNVATCPRCHTTIGLLGVEGGPGWVAYTREDGTEGAVPVQGCD
jgi:hypothetical protein